MYSINLGTKYNNPVRLLLDELLKARARGVSVTMYLNTKFRDKEESGEEAPFVGNPVFKELKDSGCTIHLIPSYRKLHDKLVIIDERYVVEGSTNWSIAALKNNFESSTIIDSPDLARVKLMRFKSFLVISPPRDETPHAPAYIENLPESLSVPEGLLLDKRYFPAMVTSYDSRSMDLYILLLAHAQAIDKKEFLISLEDMALSLGMPNSWDYTALRRQVIKSLKKLEGRYRLIKVTFFHSHDAAITLADIPGNSFSISSSSVISQLTMRLKFLLLVEAFLKGKGEDMGSISKADLAKRFNVDVETIKAAFRDSKK